MDTESPVYHERLLHAQDVCSNCLRIIRVEQQSPVRKGLTREVETHYERHRDHTEIGYGPAESASEAKGVFCDRCGTEHPHDRIWGDTPDDRVGDERFKTLLQTAIRTLEAKGVTVDRLTLAERALQRRRDGDHVDEALGEATEAGVTAAITRDDTADPDEDARREVPA